MPLVHRVCELYKLFHISLEVFPRKDRVLAQRICHIILDCLELALIAAYSPRHLKTEKVQKLSERIDFLKHLVRLTHDLKAISLEKYLALEKELIVVGKMVGGWLNQVSKQHL